MKSSREQFEEWYSKASGLCDMDLESEFNVDDNGEYIYSGARDAWEAWQASRAAIEIKLPRTKYYGDHWSGDWALDPELVVDSIDEAGLKVKS